MRKVRKAYLLDNGPLNGGVIRHVLVSDTTIFIPTSGWHSRKIVESVSRIIELPGEHEQTDWWDGWWTTNWQDPTWAWCYGQPRPPEYVFCRKASDGAIYAF